jgi:heptosyltransferase-2
MRPLDPGQPRSILVRGTNWVGDAVMTLPALAALGAACPQARITVLAKPWVAAVYQASPVVKDVLAMDPARHGGLAGIWRLAGELRDQGFDWAVLVQNAFGAALTVALAGIPVRVGYDSDARGLLLSHAIARTAADRRVHETAYYLRMLHRAGLAAAPPDQGVTPELRLAPADRAWAEDFLADKGLAGARLLGLAPGAAFGPAKCWPAERFAATARMLLAEGFDAALLFGGPGEADTTAQVAHGLPGARVLDLAGATRLGQALALLARLELFITNDSGLMHAAAALGTPTLAVFGSTNPVTTAPRGPWVELARAPLECSPCLKPVCPRGDLACFAPITPEVAIQAARDLLARRAAGGSA